MKPITLDDLHAAIAARLSEIEQQAAQKAAQAIFDLVRVDQGIPTDKNAMAAILERAGIVPEGNLETLFHALLAKGAEAAGDWHRYYPAAYLVWFAKAQSRRASGTRRGDDLDALLRRLVADFPELSPSLLWAEITRRASSAGCDVLCDWDSMTNVLSFEPRPGAEIMEIDFEAFRRRIQRIKKSMRQVPAAVASVLDDARNLKEAA